MTWKPLSKEEIRKMNEKWKAQQRRMERVRDLVSPDRPKTSEEAYPDELPEDDFVRMSNLNGITHRPEWDSTLPERMFAQDMKYAQHKEVCDPPEELVDDITDLGFTGGKEYVILDQVVVPSPENSAGDFLYKVENDDGKEVCVSIHYFRQRQRIRHERWDIETRDNIVEYGESDGPPDDPKGYPHYSKFYDAYCEKREKEFRSQLVEEQSANPELVEAIRTSLRNRGRLDESQTATRKEKEESSEEGESQGPETT